MELKCLLWDCKTYLGLQKHIYKDTCPVFGEKTSGTIAHLPTLFAGGERMKKCDWIREENYCCKPSILKITHNPLPCKDVPRALCRRRRA